MIFVFGAFSASANGELREWRFWKKGDSSSRDQSEALHYRPNPGPYPQRAIPYQGHSSEWSESAAVYRPPSQSLPSSPMIRDAEQSRGVPGPVLSRKQQFLRDCSTLARQGLTYRFGSNNPGRGGLDCSGTVEYVAHKNGFTAVPRTAHQQYEYLKKSGTLHKINPWTPDSLALRNLKPGDLLFWKGTYKTDHRFMASHVMVYLGKDPKTGKRLMFGGSTRKSGGRHGNGRGVNIYEFKWPQEGKGRFVGYGTIPGMQ